MEEPSDRSRKRVFRAVDAQDEGRTVSDASFQAQGGVKDPVMSAKGSPNEDSEDQRSPSGQQLPRPSHKRVSMSLHPASSTSRLQAFDERTSSVGLTQQVCSLHVDLYLYVLLDRY